MVKDKNEVNHYNLYYVLKENFEKEKKKFDFSCVMLEIIMESIKNRGCDDYGQSKTDNNCEGGADGG